MPAPNSEARILSRKTPRTRLASDAVAMMIAPEVILFALLWKILRIMFFLSLFQKNRSHESMYARFIRKKLYHTMFDVANELLFSKRAFTFQNLLSRPLLQA